MSAPASTLVTDSGFSHDDWTGGFTPLSEAPANDTASLDLPSDADVTALLPRLGGVAMIRIDFPSFADGRGFSLARRLRNAGYDGRLRARGHVLADQYAMARRSGFDEVEIDPALAARQPEAQWRARSDWRAHDYQSRLRA